MNFGHILAIAAIPFVITTIWFGRSKGENRYYESDNYSGNGTAH